MNETLKVNLPVFEGPLDLLLFLIRKNEIDIYDIPIARICEEYLSTIELMKDLDLDIAGEFLVMASTLARIKARMLLPTEEGEGDAEDPRAELVRDLLEYQRFREAARELSGRDQVDRDIFLRSGSGAEEFRDKRSLETPTASIFDLLLAFRKVLKNIEEEGGYQVVMERVSLLDRINEMMEMFQDGQARTFASLFDGIRTKTSLVITFLAMLELARLGQLKIYQPGKDGEIMLWPTGTDGEGGPDLSNIDTYH